MNFLSEFVRTARRLPNRTAAVWGDRTLTYGELVECVGKTASLFRRLGVRPGDRVAIALNNRPEFLFAYLGSVSSGAIAVPLNYLLKADALAFCLEDSGAKLLVANVLAGPEFSKVREQLPGVEHFFAGDEFQPGIPRLTEAITAEGCHIDLYPAAAQETAVVKYTSGTTGRPKGVMTTHDNVIALMEGLTAAHAPRAEDVVLLVVPLFHGAGDMCVMNNCLWVGAAFVMQDPFSPPAVFDAIERHRVCVFGGVPSMLHALMSYPGSEGRDLSSVRYCATGGDSMPQEQMERFERKFGVPVLEGYGLTEGTAASAFNRLGLPRKSGSVGPALPGVTIGIMDEEGNLAPAGERGEIVLRGRQNMAGYWRNPQATADTFEKGWLLTGDIGYLDEEGYLYVVDRKKDMIIMSGENIYPRELEEIIARHPAVQQVAVVGVPDRRRGQLPKAIIVLKEGHTLSEEDFLAFCREKMAFFQVPKLVEFRSHIPTGPTGKVDKKAL